MEYHHKNLQGFLTKAKNYYNKYLKKIYIYNNYILCTVITEAFHISHNYHHTSQAFEFITHLYSQEMGLYIGVYNLHYRIVVQITSHLSCKHIPYLHWSANNCYLHCSANNEIYFHSKWLVNLQLLCDKPVNAWLFVQYVIYFSRFYLLHSSYRARAISKSSKNKSHIAFTTMR